MKGKVISFLGTSESGKTSLIERVLIKYHLYRLFKMAKTSGLPLIVFVNKIDAEKTRWSQTICDFASSSRDAKCHVYPCPSS